MFSSTELIIEVLHYWKHTCNYQISWTNRKKKFAAAALDLEYKAFVIDIAALNRYLSDKVHLSKKSQIANLKADKVLIKILRKYTDFTDVFFPKLAVELPKNMKINDYTIELVDNW